MKTASQLIVPWLRANLGPACLAPLTTTDFKALRAAVEILELYAYDRNPAVLEAFRLVVLRMQESSRQFAYHAIAHVLDWSERPKVWEAAGLPPLTDIRRCKHES
jgi:hypothetical protein